MTAQAQTGCAAKEWFGDRLGLRVADCLLVSTSRCPSRLLQKGTELSVTRRHGHRILPTPHGTRAR